MILICTSENRGNRLGHITFLLELGTSPSASWTSIDWYRLEKTRSGSNVDDDWLEREAINTDILEPGKIKPAVMKCS